MFCLLLLRDLKCCVLTLRTTEYIGGRNPATDITVCTIKHLTKNCYNQFGCKYRTKKCTSKSGCVKM